MIFSFLAIPLTRLYSGPKPLARFYRAAQRRRPDRGRLTSGLRQSCGPKFFPE
jgi:hypothetical protein